MDLKQGQSLKQEQQLNQQQIQALKVLTLNQQELNSFLSEEIQYNPLLEIKEDKQENSTNQVKDYYTISQEERDHFFNNLNQQESLYDYLNKQVDSYNHSEKELETIKYIINNINSVGYLDCSLVELESNKFSLRELQKAIEKIHNFEPIGLGAENMKQCLLIQAKKKYGETSMVYKLIETDLSLIKNNNIPQISKKHKQTIDEIYEHLEKIKTLTPYPAKQISDTSPQSFVLPDIHIEKKEPQKEFQIFFNKNDMLQLQISPDYQTLDKKTLDDDSLKYIQEKTKQAKNIISAIDKRHRTLYNITILILRYQEAFFLGLSDKPQNLTIKKIAEELDLHNSTISRSIKNKYLKCPQGFYPFKYFFPQNHTTENNHDDTQSIKEQIALIIQNENKIKPLSDQKIADLLNKNYSIKIARRTVTKYREALNFPSTKMRKKFL